MRKAIGISTALLVGSLLVGGLSLAQEPRSAGSDQDPRIAELEARLEKLAQRNRVPGMSAALVLEKRLVWARGFGFADLEEEIPATEDTLYRLASVSKPFAAVLLLQLAEEGKLTLDTPMKDFTIHPWFVPGSFSGAHFPSRYDKAPITIRHVLSHTSERTPGTYYNYSGNIFNDLTWVIEETARLSYPMALKKRIFDRAGMNRTPPGHLAPDAEGLIEQLARPYRVANRRPHRGTYPGFGLPQDLDPSPWNLQPAYTLPEGVPEARRKILGHACTPLYSSTAASGVVSSVVDLAKFDVALDRNLLMSEKSKIEMFTAQRDPDGKPFPYGLGWFVEDRNGVKLVWHYGWYPPTVSALYVKAPEKQATFILLANSDQLSGPYSFSQLGVQASPYAQLFLKHFVFD